MALSDKLQHLANEDRPFDREAVVAEWKTAVDGLYGFVQQTLHQYTVEKLIRFEFSGIEVDELPLEKYHISQMRLIAGRETIIFNPLGRMIVGFAGRVDVYRQGRYDDAVKIFRLSEPPQSWVTRDTLLGPNVRRNALLEQATPPQPVTAAILETIIDQLLPE